MSLAQTNYFPIFVSFYTMLERLKNLGLVKGKAVVIICFNVCNPRGGLPDIIFVFRLRMIQRSPGGSLFCLFILQGVKQGGGSLHLLFNYSV